MTSHKPLRRSFRYAGSFFAKLALPVLAATLGVSCGDVYRPVALPIPGQSPTPGATGHMLVVSTNGSDPNNPLLSSGSSSRIDVSGDSVVSIFPTGLAPSHAVLSGSGRLFVPNADED